MFFKLFFKKKDHDFLIEAINIYVCRNVNILNILENDYRVKSKINNNNSLLYYKIINNLKVGRSFHEALYFNKLINKKSFIKSNHLFINGFKYQSYEFLLKSLKKL